MKKNIRISKSPRRSTTIRKSDRVTIVIDLHPLQKQGEPVLCVERGG